uniref:Uncharacterized protein n=1 Tax=Arundo donax TaxID=35708 RepID=A0A0A8XS32_ARUDO
MIRAAYTCLPKVSSNIQVSAFFNMKNEALNQHLSQYQQYMTPHQRTIGWCLKDVDVNHALFGGEMAVINCISNISISDGVIASSCTLNHLRGANSHHLCSNGSN